MAAAMGIELLMEEQCGISYHMARSTLLNLDYQFYASLRLNLRCPTKPSFIWTDDRSPFANFRPSSLASFTASKKLYNKTRFS